MHVFTYCLTCTVASSYRVWLLDIISAYDITQPEAIQMLISTMFHSETDYKQFAKHVTTHGEGTYKASSLSQGEFRKDVSLRSLKESVEAVEDLVRPLEGCMEEVVVLHSRESLLFKEHVALNWPKNFQVRILTKFGVCIRGRLFYCRLCGLFLWSSVVDHWPFIASLWLYKQLNIQTDFVLMRSCIYPQERMIWFIILYIWTYHRLYRKSPVYSTCHK